MSNLAPYGECGKHIVQRVSAERVGPMNLQRCLACKYESRIAELTAERDAAREEAKRLRAFAESVPGPQVAEPPQLLHSCGTCRNTDTEWPMRWHKPDCLWMRAQQALRGEEPKSNA